MKTIVRENYLKKLRDLQNVPLIKIITGVRRAGKSMLMKSFMEEIKQNDPNANIIWVDYANVNFHKLDTYTKLNNYVEKNYQKDKKNYVFIDEVQFCKKFEYAINSFHNSNKYDIYISGSNAFLLSHDLATLFVGRYVAINVFPFSYKEYKLYFNEQVSPYDAIPRFWERGGLAGSYVCKNEEDRLDYLRSLYTTIIDRDLKFKNKIDDNSAFVLSKTAEFLIDNIGNLTSANKIATTFQSNKIKTTHVTIGKYLDYLCNSFLFYKIRRYDIQGRRYLNTIDKFYLVDTSIRYAVLGTRHVNRGSLCENIVAIELLRRGYQIYVGMLYDSEVDFIAIKGNEKFYIQVADSINEEKTFKREYTPLLKIKDAYPKYIIANTYQDDYTYEGIHVVDLTKWLEK